jgi:chromosome segregation ATPase
MSYRRQPDSSLALLWLVLLCAVLLLLAATPRANGQSGSQSAPPTLSGNLEQAEMNLQTLMQRLGERQKQIADLQGSLTQADARLLDLRASLATLQGQLVLAQESLANSQTELSETLLSLDSLSLQYSALEQSWQGYRSLMQGQVREAEREARWAKVFAGVFLAGTLAGAIGCIVLALR